VSTLRTLTGGRVKSLAASVTGPRLTLHVIAIPENRPPISAPFTRARAFGPRLTLAPAGGRRFESRPLRHRARGENPIMDKRTIEAGYG